MRPETWPAILISAARRSPIRARHGRHPDQAPNRMQNGGYRMSRDCRVVTVCNRMPDPVADGE
jgi:hypothetical protein